MKLIYAYIKKFRNIQNQEICFTDEYKISFANGSFTIVPQPNSGLKELYGDSLLKNVHIIVGKTGAGKTNILQMIGMDQYARYEDEPYSEYLLLYQEQEGKHSFIIESYFREDKAAASQVDHIPVGLFKFEVKDNVPSDPVKIRLTDTKETLIINSFDRYSFSSCPYEDLHHEGFRNDSEYFTRVISPFGKTNVGIACEQLQKYISKFSENSIKRKAGLLIHSINWTKHHSPIDSELKREQYWTYYDKQFDFHKQKDNKQRQLSKKQMFLHDLLADYALYLREYLESYSKEEEIQDYEMGVFDGQVGLSNKPNPFHLPDHWGDGSTNCLIKRIEWLSMVIDRSSDDLYFQDGKGLVWQISSDIIDIYNILKSMPDKYFSIDEFNIPIVDIELGKGKPMENLFERMTGYRPDELGLFTRDLLPYKITNISSGEYQYAKVLGAIDEYCARLKLRSARENKTYRPDFILLLDEPETYMHPEMARNFLWEMNNILNRHKDTCSVQVIMTTHSPFMLSDLTTTQITCLDYDKDGYCHILPKQNETFGADINSIMANDFFLNYTIGEFSRRTLSDLITRLKGIRYCNIEDSEDVLSDADIILNYLHDGMLKNFIRSIIKEDATSQI